MLETCKNICPYCGELIEVIVDLSIEEQEYIEDCPVCCCPFVCTVIVTCSDEGTSASVASIRLRTGNE